MQLGTAFVSYSPVLTTTYSMAQRLGLVKTAVSPLVHINRMEQKLWLSWSQTKLTDTLQHILHFNYYWKQTMDSKSGPLEKNYKVSDDSWRRLLMAFPSHLINQLKHVQRSSCIMYLPLLHSAHILRSVALCNVHSSRRNAYAFQDIKADSRKRLRVNVQAAW